MSAGLQGYGGRRDKSPGVRFAACSCQTIDPPPSDVMYASITAEPTRRALSPGGDQLQAARREQRSTPGRGEKSRNR
ncbi:hypothetical protein EYF80_046123 [Liparis tanakae]|uniref:Uncharacterized protein n=1 Tax=Liparis tanakae TaxID=230148 RepID=A0A4Z2FS35_9TELE|nr:hypothetical protein EYF80_046123 [Liparis tanakae]